MEADPVLGILIDVSFFLVNVAHTRAIPNRINHCTVLAVLRWSSTTGHSPATFYGATRPLRLPQISVPPIDFPNLD